MAFTTHNNTIQTTFLGISSTVVLQPKHESLRSAGSQTCFLSLFDLLLLAEMDFWFPLVFSLGKNLFSLAVRSLVTYLNGLFFRCFQTSVVRKYQLIIWFDLGFGDIIAVIYQLISKCCQANGAFKLNIATMLAMCLICADTFDPGNIMSRHSCYSGKLQK